jgi:SAM-dependent methyltransferase
MPPGVKAVSSSAQDGAGSRSGYDAYVRAEWDEFVAHPIRRTQLPDAAGNLDIRRVLDVGCGAGQELIPFVERGAVSIGLDLSEEVGAAGRELFEGMGLGRGVHFVRGTAESLPFAGEAFDLVICRLVLPYVNNTRCMREMIRVLRRYGVLIVQIHAFRYYSAKLLRALRSRNRRSIIDSAGAMVSGIAYSITGRQGAGVAETFTTERRLRLEAEMAGGMLDRIVPIKNDRAPAYVIVKR